LIQRFSLAARHHTYCSKFPFHLSLISSEKFLLIRFSWRAGKAANSKGYMRNLKVGEKISRVAMRSQRFSLAARIVTRLDTASFFLDSVIALSNQPAFQTPNPPRPDEESRMKSSQEKTGASNYR
jgi:hypothetical protein